MARTLHDGREDGLTPLESLRLDQVDSFIDLVNSMGKTAFAGRQVGRAFDILLHMARSENRLMVLTLSGAMTVAKQGSIVCEMIDRGMVNAVVATGALMAHGLTESIGLTHYAVDPDEDDAALFKKGYNRVYDTVEMESNLNDVEVVVRAVLEENTPDDGVWSSARFCRAVGAKLDEIDAGPGILRSAYLKNVPVFIPAFTDSEIGLDFSLWAIRRALRERQSDEPLPAEEIFHAVPPFNPFLDLQEYARLLSGDQELGIFTIGGGVPRNWAQQVAPYYDITAHRLEVELREPRFKFGVRICPEPVHWGGLSGCTYREGVSWGKFVPPAEGGRYAEILADATVIWPLLMKAVFEALDREKSG